MPIGWRSDPLDENPPPEPCVQQRKPPAQGAAGDSAEIMFFDGWPAILRTLVTGVLAYGGLILLLRLSGKRTLSKWNAFDYVVTIALGSTLATVLLSKSTSLLQGLAALLLLVALQFLVTWLSVRWQSISRLVKARPTLLLYRGQLRDEALRKMRVTPEEVRAALRNHGCARVQDAAAVVLETDGSFSVINEFSPGGTSTLVDVEGFDRENHQRNLPNE